MAKLVLLEGMLSSSSSDSDSDESIDSGSWDDIFEDDDENPDKDNFNELGHPPIASENQLCITLYVLGTPDSYRRTANILEARYGFPGVIGMVDETHIPKSASKIIKQALYQP
ncbi:hypothetical protein PV328_004081 [Microctonus aethiopoides]|uniref:Uncharacterized protein n=1 Tax=Microctonus aethiopoides TaxID=144406 RepID=A0AA39F9V1_9HYME|nr:hypothetical protein PV328_004081 [Microctonus aethiopoides]